MLEDGAGWLEWKFLQPLTWSEHDEDDYSFMMVIMVLMTLPELSGQDMHIFLINTVRFLSEENSVFFGGFKAKRWDQLTFNFAKHQNYV